jgi:carboxypeptidase C (cathepsin A)
LQKHPKSGSSKSVFTMLHKLLISYDFSPMDVSSANNLHKPIVSSAMHKYYYCKNIQKVAVLRKLNFKVTRNFFETMYLSCIRPFLEYQERFEIIVLLPIQPGGMSVILK